MKAFLNILLLFLSMTYIVDNAYATVFHHSQMEEMQMDCCDSPQDDHSCCDDDAEDHCDGSQCCDCLMVSPTFFDTHTLKSLKTFESFFEAKFSLVVSSFSTPTFPIWTPPDIA